MAFFPCVRFEDQVLLFFRGENFSQRDWDDLKKMRYCINLHEELAEMYKLVATLFVICAEKNLKLILENPFSEQHYLRRYWCMKPALVDKDRRRRGDYYSKPTQYWFLNLEPKHNFIFEAQCNNAMQRGSIEKSTKKQREASGLSACVKTARSQIHPDYANRFIREFILEDV